MDRIISYPWIGKKYSNIIKQSLENLGLDVQLPPKTTSKTINIGVKNSSEMMCFPYKVTLGNLVEALEEGANTLLMWDSGGECRLRHYHKLQEFTLRKMEFDDFEMYGVSGKNVHGVLKKLSRRSSIKVLSEIYYNLPKRLKKYDHEKTNWSEDKPNIGIIGEIFCSCDEIINYGVEDKIRSYGANAFNSVTLTDFIGENVFGRERIQFGRGKKAGFKKEANKYLNGTLGGHGYENICNLLELIDNNVDGIVHLLPLTCMPEVTVEPFISHICEENKVPLLRIPIDENNSEANLNTRLETFVELIKMKRSSLTSINKNDSEVNLNTEYKVGNIRRADQDEKMKAAYLGIDCGSVGIKLALINEDR